MIFSLQTGGVASAQGHKTSCGCPQINKGRLFLTKAGTEHRVTWHRYLNQGCVPIETWRFWRSGDAVCLSFSGRSALCLMEPDRGQPLASMSLSLHLAVAGVGKAEPALALYEWGGNGKWLVSYFGKMQREMTGQGR